MKNYLFLICILSLTLLNEGLAQETKSGLDSSYIKSFREQLQVQCFLGNRSNEIRVFNKTASRTIIYQPNMPVQFGVGLDHHWLSLEAGLKLNSSTENTPDKGNSRYFGLSGSINGREIWANVQYVYYKGFHVSNPNSVQANWNNNAKSFPIRSDIFSSTLNAQIIWSQNKTKFSYLGAIEQREKQIKSAGSLLIGIGISAVGIAADSSMAPLDSAFGFEKDAQIKEAGFLVISPQIGYGYTVE